MAEPSTPRNTDYTGVTKWIVIGVIAIVGLFALKQPLERLVDRTEEVKAGSFSLKTAHTVIGEINVSTEQVSRKEAKQADEQPGFEKYVSSDFMLAWPSTWMRYDVGIAQTAALYQQMGINATIHFYCRQKAVNKWGGSSNAYVASAPYDNSMEFTQQVEQYKLAVTQALHARIVSENIDPETKGATFILNFEMPSAYGDIMSLYQIQRFSYKDGQIFQLITTTLVDDKATQEELRSILNSFRIVRGVEA